MPVAYITEAYFDSEEAMQGAPVSPKGEAALADPENFTDVERPPS